MKENLIIELSEKGFVYKESDYQYAQGDQEIGRELTRFRWGKPEYKGHFKVYHKVHYFDEFIMTEIKRKVEEYNNKIQEGKLHERI